MNPVKNIVGLPQTSVFDSIRTFLDDKEINSINTRMAYETDIRQFFEFTRNKSIESLIEDDIKFTHNEIVKYRKFLTEAKYANSSINRKMATIKKLFTYLAIDYDFIRTEIFNLTSLRHTPKSYGVLTWEEVAEMIERVKAQRKGKEKALLIELAARTSFRINALLNIEWEHIVRENGVMVVKIIDKGMKKDEKPIPDSFYEELLTLKKDGVEKVFSITKKTCWAMMNTLCKEMGISEERNITFHSLRKQGINFAMVSTGDIMLASRQGNHSSFQTTYKYYLENNKDFDSMPGLVMGTEIDTKPLDEATKEELITAIKNAGVHVQLQVLKVLKDTGS